MSPPPPPPPGYEPPSAEPPPYRPPSYGPPGGASSPGPSPAPGRSARRDPATEILAWLRGAFDDVNANLRALSDRIDAQQAAMSAASGSQAAELNVTLAELEGCAARLRNEAATFAETKAALVEALPGLVSEAVGPALTRTVERVVGEAVRPAVGHTVERAVADLRLAVAELGAALTEAVPAAVVDADASALATRLPAGGPAPEMAPVGAAAVPAGDEESGDLVSQLHQAQDEAAEWFSIVVEEAVRQAVERYLGPVIAGASPGAAPAAPTPAPASSPPSGEAAPVAGPPPPPPTEGPAPAPVPPPAPTPEPAHGPELRSGPQPEPRSGPPQEPRSGPPPASPAAPAAPLPEAGAESVGAPGGDTAPGPGPALRSGPQPGSPSGMQPVSPSGMQPAAAGDSPPAPEVAPAADVVPAPGAAPDPGLDADDDARPPSAVACALPGGFVGPTLALGTREALRRARLRRRRRRRAGAPNPGRFLHDPFAGEVSQALERFAVSRRGLAFGADGAEPPGNGVVVVGERDGQEVAVDLASAALALVGPGAADAARALVATFLACTEPAAGEAVVVGDLFPPGRGFPGLRRLGDRAAAADELEAELTRREAYRTEEGAPPLPALLVVTVVAAGSERNERPAWPERNEQPAGPERNGRLAGLLERGRALRVGAVVVGSEAVGATAVTVSSRGTVRSVVAPEGAPALGGARLFVLDEAAAGELLGVLAAARTDEERVPAVPVEDEPFVVLAPSEEAPISVRVLGEYRIEAGGREIRSGLRAKARELLAFYLLHPEGTTLDVATEALWPEADPGRGSEWFWTALGNLRSLLRSATGTKGLKVIERDGDRYRIEPVLFEVDLWRFQEALPPAGASTGDAEWAAGLQAAADLYGGELLAGADWAWAEVPREDLRRRAVDVLVALAAPRLVAGDARAALDALSRAVEIDPVAEQLYRRIMRLHARQARVDEVEATYLRLKARLAELDLEPTAESHQLLAELSRTSP